MRGSRACIAAALVLALAPATVTADPLEKAREAVDPDCTIADAARGAATKAAVGVRGNRCELAETTRDTLGVDDRDRKKRDDDGGRKRLRED